MNKIENIEFICMKLQGLTKLNFQINLGYVLESFYKSKGLTYEMPSANGGDDKNDGWVEEEALFYQVYAPSQLRTSLGKDMQDKFKADLEGLIKKLEQGKWNGKIKRFVFLVNTFDDHLPKDSDRFYFNLVEKIKREYGFDFEYEIQNLRYVKRLLMGVEDSEVFDLIKVDLNLTTTLPTGTITNNTMHNFLTSLGNQIMCSTINGLSSDYSRISTPKKIEINNLGELRDEINGIIDNLSIVEDAVNELNQDIETSEMFEKIVHYIISSYSLLATEYSAVELFNRLCDSLSKVCSDTLIVSVPSKYLVVYVFDRCDIFEKEEVC